MFSRVIISCIKIDTLSFKQLYLYRSLAKVITFLTKNHYFRTPMTVENYF